MAQVPGHNKKALRRGGNIIAPFCLPVNRYLKICPTTAHFFAAGSRSVPGGGRAPALPADLAAVVPGGGHNGFGRRSIFYFSRFSAPLPRRGRISPRPPSRREGGDQGYFMQGAPPLASPRLNPRGTGKWGRTKRPAGGTAVLLAGLLCHCGSPAGGTMVLVAGRFFTLAVFLPPFPEGEGYPPDPLPGGKGGDFRLFYARGEAPCIRKQKNLPLPQRGRGAGGWGKERKLKAGLTGDKEGKPPLRLLERQGQPATRKARPPPGAWFAPYSRVASGSALGMQGAKPLA